MLYHYPETNRVGSTDESEIRATKNAHHLDLPVFVITHPYKKAKTRDVKLGWIEDWDDASKVFLIRFGGSTPPAKKQPIDDTPFRLKSRRKKKTSTSEKDARTGQQRFKFECLQRYGTACAVCGISVPEVLDAAHLCPAEENGSDDPRNGLILCVNHHRALDGKLFAIEPQSLEIRIPTNALSAPDLRIGVDDIAHLSNLPHADALELVWSKFVKEHGV